MPRQGKITAYENNLQLMIGEWLDVGAYGAYMCTHLPTSCVDVHTLATRLSCAHLAKRCSQSLGFYPALDRLRAG